MKQFIKNNSGLSLMEVVVALAVVVTGVVSGLTLTTYNLNTSAASEQQLAAVNLARESLEVVRSMRDSNWLAALPWNENILADGVYKFTVDFNPLTIEWIINEQADEIELADCDDCRIYLNKENGVYSHNPAGELTDYKRLMVVRDICWQNALENESIAPEGQTCSQALGSLVGWQVESRISWMQADQTREIVLTDKLYDWK